jgi:hypothetical protein
VIEQTVASELAAARPMNRNIVMREEMIEKRPMPVMIGGAPWVGKSSCARVVFEGIDNSAWLDGDDVWRVNPFSVQDPRLRNSDANMSFVLQTYLLSPFDYVDFSSVVLTDQPISSGILNAINVPEYDIIFFMLTCSLMHCEHAVCRGATSRVRISSF